MRDETLSAEERAFAAAAGTLDGHVVILTGATGGIGQTIARMLVAAGASLAVTDVASDRVDALASDLEAYGEAVDVSSGPAFDDFRARVEAELGPLDGLVNCAGLWAPLAHA